MADLGTDIGGVLDIDRNLSFTSGRRGLAESIAREWLEPQGGFVHAPEHGEGLLAYVNAPVYGLGSLAQRLEGAALRDERVEAADVSAEFVGDTLTISGRITDSDGPFDLVLTVSQMTSSAEKPAVELFLENA